MCVYIYIYINNDNTNNYNYNDSDYNNDYYYTNQAVVNCAKLEGGCLVFGPVEIFVYIYIYIIQS